MDASLLRHFRSLRSKKNRYRDKQSAVENVDADAFHHSTTLHVPPPPPRIGETSSPNPQPKSTPQSHTNITTTSDQEQLRSVSAAHTRPRRFYVDPSGHVFLEIREGRQHGVKPPVRPPDQVPNGAFSDGDIAEFDIDQDSDWYSPQTSWEPNNQDTYRVRSLTYQGSDRTKPTSPPIVRNGSHPDLGKHCLI